MHYSTISSDLELVSVLNKIFLRKKPSPGALKVTNFGNDRSKKKDSECPSPKQYIKVNVLPSRQSLIMTDTNKQPVSPQKFYYSPRQFQSPTEVTELNGSSKTNFSKSNNVSDALYNIKHSSLYKRKEKNKSFSYGEYQMNNLQLKCNQFNKFNNKEYGNSNYHIYQRKVSIDSFIEQKKKQNIIENTSPDELIILESKINSLLSVASKKNDCTIPCCDIWAFYIKSAFSYQQKDYFQKQLSKVIIHSLSNLLMLIVILTYDISNDLNLFVQLNLLFKTIFTLLQLNYLLLAKFIISQLNQRNPSIKEFTEYLNERVNGKTQLEFDEIEICLMIRHNSTSIVDLIRIIFNNISQENNTYKELLIYFNNLSNIEPKELIHFFNNKIFKRDTQQSRSLIIQKEYFTPIFTLRLKEPYLPPKKSTRRYTLLIGLDEVLISFSYGIIVNKEKKGILFLRPGLMNFLTIIGELYELILFTSATKDYVTPILQVIEQDKKLFDYCLYREHCYLFSNERIKDLSKIGRDITKAIIVDNNANNFKLNKGNGILIHSFFGNDCNDSTLLKLQSLLIKIAKEANGHDIRKVLSQYHNEITKTISSDIYMRKTENPLNPILINFDNE